MPVGTPTCWPEGSKRIGPFRIPSDRTVNSAIPQTLENATRLLPEGLDGARRSRSHVGPVRLRAGGGPLDQVRAVADLLAFRPIAEAWEPGVRGWRRCRPGRLALLQHSDL